MRRGDQLAKVGALGEKGVMFVLVMKVLFVVVAFLLSDPVKGLRFAIEYDSSDHSCWLQCRRLLPVVMLLLLSVMVA